MISKWVIRIKREMCKSKRQEFRERRIQAQSCTWNLSRAADWLPPTLSSCASPVLRVPKLLSGFLGNHLWRFVQKGLWTIKCHTVIRFWGLEQDSPKYGSSVCWVLYKGISRASEAWNSLWPSLALLSPSPIFPPKQIIQTRTSLPHSKLQNLQRSLSNLAPMKVGHKTLIPKGSYPIP